MNKMIMEHQIILRKKRIWKWILMDRVHQTISLQIRLRIIKKVKYKEYQSMDMMILIIFFMMQEWILINKLKIMWLDIKSILINLHNLYLNLLLLLLQLLWNHHFLIIHISTHKNQLSFQTNVFYSHHLLQMMQFFMDSWRLDLEVH